MCEPGTGQSEFLIAWLRNVPDNHDSSIFECDAISRPTKHKRESGHRLLSPPASLRNVEARNDMPPRTPKKRKANHDDADANEPTPRAQPPSLRPSDAGDSHSISSGTQSESQKSGRSSPIKLYSTLSLEPAGLKRVPMDVLNPDLPESLADLIEEMESIGMGKSVVPIYLKAPINEQKSTRNARLFKKFDDSVYTPEDDERQLKLDSILETVAMAHECEKTAYDETGWNHLVHSPLLDMAFGRLPQHLVGFSPCMSASITGEYRINRAAGARVDYAIFVNPDYDTGVQVHDAIERLQRAMPEKSVNHTAFFPIRNRPISVSIETKRASGSQDKALLQIGIWQSSQWKLLADLAGPEAVQKLPFIPGVVVEGHDWKLAATTYHAGKTTLWTDQSFGNTKTALGTFEVITGLHRLRKWTSETYWPWYKKHILRFSGEALSTIESVVALRHASHPAPG